LIRIEGFYTGMTLPPRSASTWFSAAPALPERDFRIFGGSLLFNTANFGFAADGAYSETFAYGRDFYMNMGLRLGDKPWRLSLAADSAGDRYVGSDGNSPGAGFRAAAKLEWRGRGSSLLRFNALLRGSKGIFNGESAAISETFANLDRGEFGLYYRLPSTRSPLGLTRVSAEFKRDSRDPQAVLDSAGVLAALKLGPISSVSEAKLSASSYRFGSLRIQESLGWTLGLPGLRVLAGGLHCGAKAGCTLTEGKAPTWDGSLSAYIQGRWFVETAKTSRFSVKIASPDFPRKWDYTLSWRLQY
jgi:hypothetical protein